MPRLVRHDADGHVKLEPSEKPYWICGCGLTQNFPHCDGSHKACKAEAEGKLNVYDKDRKTIIEERDDA